MSSATNTTPLGGRLTSLDAYRGFVMLAMVSGGLGLRHLIHDPTWGWLADQFEHRAWEGCTFWDLIQPSFMFIVGVAIPLAFARRQERGESWGRQFAHVMRRCLLLLLIGVLLDCYGKKILHIELVRVLQQIAIGYFLAFLVLQGGPVVQGIAAAAVLVAHTAAYRIYGAMHEAPAWVLGKNVGTALDQWLGLPFELGQTTTQPNRGGYVTLNALSATATILFGVLCGELLRSQLPQKKKLAILAAASVGGLALGAALAQWAGIPMVKRIWTASFAIYAAGWTFLLLLAFYTVIEVLNWRWWTFPFVVVGMNSIAMYVFSESFAGVVEKTLAAILPIDMEHPAGAGPVIFAVIYVAVKWYFCYWLYRHRIFFKV